MGDADVPTPDPRGLTTWRRHTTSGDHDRWQPYSPGEEFLFGLNAWSGLLPQIPAHRRL
jgi:hypothetical protein